MIRENDLLFISVTFHFLVTCCTLHRKYPANISVSKAGSPNLNYTYAINIEGMGNSWNLKLLPLKNIWPENILMLNITENKNEAPSLKNESFLKNLKIYHDPEIGSVLSIKGEDVNGIIDTDFSIISENKSQYIIKLQHEENEIVDVLIPNINSVVDFRNISLDNETLSDFANLSDTNPRTVEILKKLSIPSICIDAYLDFELSNMIGDNSKVIEYLAIFWNSVAISFRKMDPSFEIDIMICNLAKYENDSYCKIDLPFITNSSKTIEVSDILNGLSNWAMLWYGDSYYEDIVFVHTNKDLTHQQSSRILGVSLMRRGICEHISVSVVTGEDEDAVFNGVRTAAHEVAHILGSDHDGTENYCSAEDGYIMGRRGAVKENFLSFSNCTLESIKTTLSYNWEACMLRKWTNIFYQYGELSKPLSTSFSDRIIKYHKGRRSF